MTMKILLVLVLFSSQLWGQSTVSWNCPQDDYDKVPQLVESAKVEIIWNEKKQEYKFKPNIFKPKLFSAEAIQTMSTGQWHKADRVRVDYSYCINNFLANFSKKNQDPKALKQIEKQIYDTKFLKKEATFIPRSMPGSNHLESEKDIKANIKQFCESGEKNISREILFSQNGLSYLKKQSEVISGEISLDCYKKIADFSDQYLKLLNKDICPRLLTCGWNEYSNFSKTIQANRDNLNKSIASFQAGKFKKYNFISKAEEAETKANLDKFLENGNWHCNSLENTVKTKTGWKKPYLFNEFIAKNSELLVSKMGVGCFKTFIQNYAGQIPSPDIDDDDEVSGVCLVHKLSWCEEVKTASSQKLKNLQQIVGQVYGKMGTRFTTCEDGCFDKNVTPLSEILDKFKESQKTLSCMEMKKGETKVIQQGTALVDLGSADYAIKKIADDKYKVSLNLAFMTTKQSNVSPEEMRERYKECLKIMNPYLKGPKGEVININLLSNQEIEKLPLSERPPQININLMEDDYRSTSRQYESNIDCPTIAHETLHTLGLCDEYDGARDGHTCRVQAQVTSIMSNQNSAFAQTVPRKSQCQCSTETCKKIISSTTPEVKEIFFSKALYAIMDDVTVRSDNCTLKMKYNASLSEYQTIGQPTKAVQVGSTYEFTNFQLNELGSTEQFKKYEYSCHCQPFDQKCLQVMDTTFKTIQANPKIQKEFCPGEFSTTLSNEYTASPSDHSKIELPDTFYLVKQPTAKSLLHPQHFERIIGADCPEKAKQYTECGKWAYKGGDCKDRPEHCKGGKSFLGVKE